MGMSYCNQTWVPPGSGGVVECAHHLGGELGQRFLRDAQQNGQHGDQRRLEHVGLGRHGKIHKPSAKRGKYTQNILQKLKKLQ